MASSLSTRPSTSPLRGAIEVTGDKSISHRALILGSISEGTSTLKGFLNSADCRATLTAFKQMGVRIEGPVSNQVIIHGVGKYGLKAPDNPIDCGNSGTTIRLLSGLLAAQPFETRLIGDASLSKRPMERVITPLKKMGGNI